jgi:hypothetical protein
LVTAMVRGNRSQPCGRAMATKGRVGSKPAGVIARERSDEAIQTKL